MSAEPLSPSERDARGRRVSVADAKAHLSALLRAVEDGEEVSITRRGRSIARLVPDPAPRKPIDIALLRKLTDDMSYSSVSAIDIVREMRDSGY